MPVSTNTLKAALGVPRGRDADPATILDQIGRWTLASIGAREFVPVPSGLVFKALKSRYFRVVLTPADLYDVSVGRINRSTGQWVELGYVPGLYNDQLAGALIRLADQVAQ